jgi:hypothetical protein
MYRSAVMRAIDDLVQSRFMLCEDTATNCRRQTMSATAAAFAESGHGGTIPRSRRRLRKEGEAGRPAPCGGAGQHAFWGTTAFRIAPPLSAPQWGRHGHGKGLSVYARLPASRSGPASFRGPSRRGIVAGIPGMRANGVQSLDVSCRQCPHRAILSADPWPITSGAEAVATPFSNTQPDW